MDRETIMKLAREAGWPDSLVVPVIMDKLADFAKLVAEHEREACAKVCENGVDTEHPTVKGHIMKDFGASSLLAAAIRARSK